MPATSSGDVSARTRIAGSSRNAISTAFSGSKTTLPTAAAGVAGSPRAIDVYVASGSTVFTRSWCSDSGSMRRSAVCLALSARWAGASALSSNRPSRAISTAMRTAAAAVRLPERVCKM